MRIRSKLVALIAIPLIALSLAAGFGFANQSSVIETAETSAETLVQAEVLHHTALAIGNERLRVLGADVGDTDDLQATTDEAFVVLASKFTADADKSASIEEARLLVEQARSSDGQSVELLIEANATLAGLDSDAADAYPSAVARNSITANRTAIWALEATEVSWIRYIQASDGMPITQAQIVSSFTTANNRFSTAARLSSENGATTVDSLLLTAPAQQLNQLEILALADLPEGEYSVDNEQILTALSDFRPEFVSTIMQLDGELATLITNDLKSANDLRSLFTLLAIVGVVVLTGLIFVIYRSITNPLESLLERASSVANVELPSLMQTLREDDGNTELPSADPIPITSSDEIGELVAAFNDVQVTAYDLATEQALGRRNVADMFINLGRRNQQLLQRILAQLTQLEQEEEDPDKLRGLFELDNIVTRMRRNAESLLALAGAQTARQWSQPIAMENTVRAAFGEVEGYERIDVANLAEVNVTGSVVADITHLLAELLENAIKYSEPTTTVEVNGQIARNGYVINIIDKGIGMSQRELDENNSRITDPPPLDQVPTKFLGLYVVGRLAERHEIEVSLGESANGGIAARVLLPESILVADKDSSAPIDLPIRNVDDEPHSPLEEDHDLDAELAELTEAQADTASDEEADVEVEVEVDEEVEVEAQDEVETDAQADTDTDDELPVRGKKSPEAKPETKADASDGSQADAKPQAATAVLDDTDTDLPTRGRKQRPNPKKAKRRKADAQSDKTAGEPATAKSDQATAETPTETTTETKAETTTETAEAETENVEAKQSQSPAAEAIDGLPVRNKGRSLQEVPTANIERATVADRSATDTSTEAASGFSSMMSALSTGVNRGIDERDLDDDPTESDE